MFKRILVPLDGSPRAENALPVAARIARASDGTVMLLRVVGIPAEYSTYIYSSYLAQTPIYAQEILDAEQANAEVYLANLAKTDTLAGLKVETNALSGAAGMTILDTACDEHIDIIVMCSHGETGFRRWALGSVALQVSRHSPVPVLVLREDGTAPTGPFPDRLRPLRSVTALVALDGSKLAEAALEPAAYLAAALAAPARGTLLLSTVVNVPAARNKLEIEEHVLDEARKYLLDIAEHLQAGELAKLDLAIDWSIELSKDVADALINAAENGKVTESSHEFPGCDLVAMATHGRGGLQRWVLGSVTERVLGATKLPLLIVRPKVEQEQPEKSSESRLI
jgi:nucleotide-binding universal stress UspA family protein